MKPFQKVSLDLVPQIKEALKNDIPASVVPLQMVDMYVKCTRILPDIQVNLYTPGGVIDEFGTFILHVPEHRGNFMIHTTSRDLGAIQEAVFELPDIDWKQIISMGPIDIKLDGLIHEIIKVKQLINGRCQISDNLSMSREKALNLTITVPDGLELRKLNTSHTEFVNSRWPHGVPGSQNYIEDTLKINGGVGLFFKDEETPVSWALYCMIGGVGMIQTLEEFRGRRYGDVVAKAVTRMVADDGFDPQVQINTDLAPSKKLFSRMGYSVTHQVTWHLYNK